MGSDDDRMVLETVRRFTDRPIRVDANEGWTLSDAMGRLEWLEEMGVEFVEQPLPPARRPVKAVESVPEKMSRSGKARQRSSIWRWSPLLSFRSAED